MAAVACPNPFMCPCQPGVHPIPMFPPEKLMPPVTTLQKSWLFIAWSFAQSVLKLEFTAEELMVVPELNEFGGAVMVAAFRVIPVPQKMKTAMHITMAYLFERIV